MAFGLDSTGFTIKRLPDIIASMKAKAVEVFGEGITTDDDSVIGQLIAVWANELATVWEGMQGTYDAFRPDAAEGVNLDEVCDLNAIVRLPATPTTVTALLTGTPSTVIAAGSLASVLPTNSQFELQEEVTLDTASVGRAEITSGSANGTYTLTVNGVAYSHVASGQTAAQIVNAIEALVAADLDATFSFIDNTDGTFELRNDDTSAEFTLAVTVNLTIDRVARVSEWEASDVGEVPAPAGTLTRIDTPIFGWDEITNPVAGTTGTEVETDTALRLRRRASVSRPGAGTVDAISANLRQVEGVTHAFVVENRGFTVDGDGRPPKSFEAIVIGGDEQDIGDTIWERKPAGIETYGDTEVNVLDSQGNDRVVYFSRPDDVWVHLRLTYELYDEEVFPSNGEQSIVDAAVEYGNSLGIGEDLILQRLYGPMFAASAGVASILIEVATSASEGDPAGAYSTANLSVGSQAIARFAAARVIIQEAP
jgi:uncharacterized phage protein gp47/JayE